MRSTDPTVTLGDCLELMDHLDASLAVLSRLSRPTTEEVQLKSMLTVIRREIADRVLQITQASVVRGAARYASDSKPQV
jgi:hypothetical protein